MKFNSRSFRVSTAVWDHRAFDPGRSEDLAEYKYFLQKQAWRDSCPFFLEWPFSNIPEMIEHKIVRHHLTDLVKLTKPVTKTRKTRAKAK